MLHKNGIEFNLLTAGSSTTLVKSAANEWNQLSKAKVYEAIQFIDDSTNLAEAVLYASTLTGTSRSSKSKNTLFIITDGYDSTPKKLQMSLSYAESIGIQTIGLGVGFFTDAIFSYFPNYVVVNHPDSLPKALQQFYCGEATVDLSQSAIQYQIEEEESCIESNGEKLTTLQMVWGKNMADVYAKQVDKIRTALYLAMSPARSACNTMSIDVCFVMDTTGSMTSYISSAKKYVIKMTDDIKKNVQVYGKTAKLRVAYVSYKNVGNAGHLQTQRFTEDIKQVEAVLKTVRASGGRGDEDKYDGINMAMSLNWEGTIRFLVLIADMPGYKNRAADMPDLIGKIATNNIHLMYVSIVKPVSRLASLLLKSTPTKRDATRVYTEAECKAFRQYYFNVAPLNMKNKGFMELNLKDDDDSDKLMNMITKSIDEVICSEFL